MKYIQILSATILLTVITGFSYGQDNMIVNASDIEIQVIDKNCWVELFEDTGFDADDPHVRVLGPFESSTLADVAGQNWNDEIQSLIVGPSATVYAYKNRDFSGPEIVFASNQRVRELGELDMSDDIESLKIECEKE